MKHTIWNRALAIGVVVALALVSAPGLAAAQAGPEVSISSQGCAVTVSFQADQTITYGFDVFEGGTLLDEQYYTVMVDTPLPVTVTFTYLYTGAPENAPVLDITVYASDSVIAEFDGYTGLTETCQAAQQPPEEPAPPADPPGDGETPAPQPQSAVAGCSVNLKNAVVGSFVLPASFYFKPGVAAGSGYGAAPGQTAWVLGVDESGEYYKIAWGCNYLWVLTSTMGPNYDKVWNGAPLPTTVVE